MIALRFLLTVVGIAVFGSAAAVVAYDVYMAARLRLLLEKYSLRAERNNMSGKRNK